MMSQMPATTFRPLAGRLVSPAPFVRLVIMHLLFPDNEAAIHIPGGICLVAEPSFADCGAFGGRKPSFVVMFCTGSITSHAADEQHDHQVQARPRGQPASRPQAGLHAVRRGARVATRSPANADEKALPTNVGRTWCTDLAAARFR